MDLTLGGTGDGYRTHTIDTGQRVGDVFVKNLVQARHALSGLYREQHDGNHVAAELEDDGGVGIVGQHTRHHVEFVAHVVGQRFDVITVFKLQGHNRDVLAAVGRDVLEVLYRVEGILKRTGHVLLDVRCASSRIAGHHHDGVGLHVREQVDGQAA